VTWKRRQPCDFLPNTIQVAETQAELLGELPDVSDWKADDA
jgi:hypothetical protein